MGFVIPIALAKGLFYWLTFWSSFKALKIPKTRKKIPRLAFRRTESGPVTIPQTPLSSDPLTNAQKTRRTQIKSMTKICLVWVMWTRLKYLLDWVSWAIPFYDEIHLVMLIWMIVMGPSSADFLFRHVVKRFAAPYEKTFDSILGTTHDFLLMTMFVITCGPKYLKQRYDKWKAHQFTKSLLSARSTAPPTRLPSLQSFQFQSGRNFSRPAAAGPHVNSTAAFQRHPSHSQHPLPILVNNPEPLRKPSHQSGLQVPQRRPTLSRKLSNTYKRSVSNSSSRSALDHRASCRIPKEVRVLENRLVSKPPLATAHLNTLREPKPMIFGSKNLLDLPPIQPTMRSNETHVTHQPLGGSESHTDGSKALEADENEPGNNSIIIHDDISEPAHPIFGPGWSQTHAHVQSRKRAHRQEDPNPSTSSVLDSSEPEPQADTSLRKRRSPTIDRARELTRSPAVDQQAEAPPSKRQKVLLTASPNTSEDTSEAEDSFEEMVTETPTSLNFASPHASADVTGAEISIWGRAPNAAMPMPDESLSPTKVPPPPARRRLHNPNEPLPVYQAGDIRDQALDSLRALTHWDLPSSERTPRSSKLNPRISGLIHTVSKSSISPHSHDPRPKSSTQRKGPEEQVKKTSHASKTKSHEQTRRVSSLSKPREISGNLGKQKALMMEARRVESQSRMNEAKKDEQEPLKSMSRRVESQSRPTS